MTIRPIETRYAGFRFRSRLEARWAVFFDTLGIKWEYEPQGYMLDGKPYLPDFKLHLPDQSTPTTDDAMVAQWERDRIAELTTSQLPAPEYGSPSYLQLPADDPRRPAAVIEAARQWRRRRLDSPTAAFAEVKNAETDEHEGEHIQLCRSLARGSGLPVVLLAGPPAYRMYHQFTPALPPSSFTAAFFQDYGPMLRTADAYWYERAVLNCETGVFEFPLDDRGAAHSFGASLVKAVQAARSARFEHGERGR